MIKIMLVDDHKVILDGLKILLPTIIPCQILATASNGKEAIEKSMKIDVDVIIMDLVMPGEFDGIAATKKIKSLNPEVKILCLTMLTNASTIDQALTAGANGYTIKNASGEELKEAINSILKNETYIHHSLIKFFILGYNNGKIKRKMLLNDMDFHILKSISNGKSTKEISEELFRSEETIKSRRKSLLKKFNCTNSVELVALALRNKLID